MDTSNTRLITFNCQGVYRSADCVRRLCRSADVIALQETWLLPHDVTFLAELDADFAYTGKSAVDTGAGVLRGRPYGGVALVWRKSLFTTVSVIQCVSVRLVAIKISLCDRELLVFSLYMPTDCSENLVDFTACLGEISAIVDSNNVENVFVLADFNAHPGESFCTELLDYCKELNWTCVDLLLLPVDTYTFVSQANGARRWLDHVTASAAAARTVTGAQVLDDVYWSDHKPLLINCDLNLVERKLVHKHKYSTYRQVVWGIRDAVEIAKYHDLCNKKLREIDFPIEFSNCCDQVCNNLDHTVIIEKMYKNIVTILTEAAECTFTPKRGGRGRVVAGWNQHVRDAHAKARLDYQTWLLYGQPKSGIYYNNMFNSRKIFKSKLKWCQKNQQQIKMNIIANHHKKKEFGKFWNATNKLNPRPSLPMSVAGKRDPGDIANLFKDHFRVESPLGESITPTRPAAASGMTDRAVVFSIQDIKSTVRGMVRGKSPGHDGLSIEHLQHAGVHLPRVLAMLFNFCIGHSYLPHDMMRTIVTPIVKDRTGDSADCNNYRPISLATVIAKVLDSLLDQQLNKYINIHDAQFGFQTNLSTESAILSLKHTVRYYTDRKTPVFACFLDLSKAFDLVSYDILWRELNVSGVPSELINIFRYWYGHQTNQVRWAESLSDSYRLRCGVRQGGTASPRLFNLYINRLLVELSNTQIGCHIDGVCVNNISYADDMVLLSPSIAALRRLLSICERFAEAHGLRYNAKKSEIMVFKAGTKGYSFVPPVSLRGTPLKQVTAFKYLGHWVTEDLKDDMDIMRERRALAVRCNMLARRFALCTNQVKVTLFKAYCQSFYTCSLWVNYTRKAYSALRVQYNDALRILLRKPRHCSASTMFAEVRADGFHAVMRKRCAATRARLCASRNSILSAIADRWDSPFLRHWVHLHASV